MLSELLKGPMMFEAKENGEFSVAGETVIGPLLPPNAMISASMAVPKGTHRKPQERLNTTA